MGSFSEKLVEAKLASMPPRPFQPDLIFDFDQVKEAVAMVEGAIKKSQEHVQSETHAARRTARAAAADPDHSFLDEPVFAPLGEALFDSALTFPRILRGAMMIAICSQTEYVVLTWCEKVHAEWHLSLPLHAFKPKKKQNAHGLLAWVRNPFRKKKDNQVPDLERYMLYLADVAGVAANFKQWKEWRDIDAYRVLRNKLAHNGGILAKEKDRKKVAALPSVVVEKGGLLSPEPTIFLTDGACEAAIDAAKKFLDHLTLVCQRHPRAQPTGSSGS